MWLAVSVLGMAAGAGVISADVQTATERSDAGLAISQNPDNAGQMSVGLAPTIATGSVAPGAAPTGPVRTSTDVLARTIRVEGNESVPPAEINAALASYIGHRLSRKDLRDLLAAVSGVARAHGFIFASSSLPEQSAGEGVLRVVLDEGRIDEIRLTGTRNAAVLRGLQRLVGHPVKQAELERQISLAGDLPGVTIGHVQYVREGVKGILVVPVKSDKLTGSASLDNRGDRSLGPERLALTLNLNGVLGEDDVLTLGGLVTPLQPRELGVATFRYAVEPNSSGTELSVFGSYGRTRSGGYWRAFDLNSKSASLAFAVSEPLIRSRRSSLWLAAELDYIAVDQRFSGHDFARDRLATAGISLNGYLPLAGGRLGGRIGVTQGLDLLGATPSGDPLASRPDASGEFTVISAQANWTAYLQGPFSAAVSAAGQLATTPLLAVEQINMGGALFGRAYDYGERAGDDGVLVSAELQAKLRNRSTGILRFVQVYAFADAGTVGNLRNRYGTGSLYSAGLGSRLLFDKSLWIQLESAFPIGADRLGTEDHSARISASITSAF